MSGAVRGLAVLGLLALGLLGCGERELVVNERFVPTTVGIVAKSEELEAGGQPRYWYLLVDGRVIEVAVEDLDPFSDPVPDGDLLLMGDGPSPWIIRAVAGPGYYSLAGRAIDRGTTIEIEMDRERGLFLVVPKAPGYRDHGTKANGEVYQSGNFLDDQGRARGPSYSDHTEEIDVEPPVSKAGPLEPITSEAWARVDCVATDDHGVHSMQLWRRFRAQEGDPWGAWEQILTQDACPFAIWLDAGIGFYEFATVAVDEAWNKEPLPEVGDAAIQRLPGAQPSPSGVP